MARIRSIHPGLATDEQYMALSHVAARVFPLLLCECDDHGIFEWKLLTLKARLLPAHNDDMAAILAELEQHEFVTKFVSAGKSYGAVRNFCRYQRPKKPHYIHLLPDEFRTYVGLTDAGGELGADEVGEVGNSKPMKSEQGGTPQPSSGATSPPVPHQGGKVSAVGVGVGVGGKSSDPNGSAQAPPDPVKALFDFGVSILTAAGQSETAARSLIGKWRKGLRDDAKLMTLLISARNQSAVEPVAYITKALEAELEAQEERRKYPNGRPWS